MFKSIWREIRDVRVHAVVLLAVAVALVYFDANRLLTAPLSDSFHVAILGLAALSLVVLHADGAAPPDRVAGTTWPLSDRRRRYDALKAALLIFATLVFCGVALALFQQSGAGNQVSASADGGPIVIYRPTSAAEDALALADSILGWLAALGVMLLGLTAPACAALFGFHRTIAGIWVTWRRRYIPLFIATALAALVLTPSAILLQPVEAFWSAVSDQDYSRYVYDLCVRAGPSNMGRYAAGAFLLFGVVLWIYSRAVARIIEQPRG